MQIYNLPITLHSCENLSLIVRENTDCRNFKPV